MCACMAHVKVGGQLSGVRLSSTLWDLGTELTRLRVPLPAEPSLWPLFISF